MMNAYDQAAEPDQAAFCQKLLSIPHFTAERDQLLYNNVLSVFRSSYR